MRIANVGGAGSMELIGGGLDDSFFGTDYSAQTNKGPAFLCRPPPPSLICGEEIIRILGGEIKYSGAPAQGE